MNGHFNFHYDEALARIGPDRGYVPDSWYELDTERALPTAALVEIYPPPSTIGDYDDPNRSGEWTL